MDDNKHSRRRAQPEENKPVFGRRVVRVGDHQGALIQEDRPGFFERDAMLLDIRKRLGRVSLEVNGSHETRYVRRTYQARRAQQLGVSR